MKKTLIKVFILALSLLILASCKSSESLKALKLDKNNLNLEVGQTERINLTAEPANVSIPEIIWSVSDKNVAEVDNTGLVKAISAGKCIITAKTKDGKFSVESYITINPKSIKELKLDKSSVSMDVGSSQNLKLTIEPSDAAIPEIQWVSSDEKVVTVDNKGIIKAVSAGKAIITAKIKDGVLSAVCNVTVNTKSVKGIKFIKTSLTLQTGSKEKLQVVFNPTDAANQNITFSSSNNKVATVDAIGTAKGIAPGTAYITARSKDGGFTAKCTITVNQKPTTVNSNILFRKKGGGYMAVMVYEHVGWQDLLYSTSDLTIYIENSRLFIKFNDVHFISGGKDVGPIVDEYSVGVGITVKSEDTGQILFKRDRTDQ